VPNLCLTRAHSSAFQRTKPARRDRLRNRARVSAVLRVTGFMRQDYPGARLRQARCHLLVFLRTEWDSGLVIPGRLVRRSLSSRV
jgi:hypothetical protein